MRLRCFLTVVCFALFLVPGFSQTSSTSQTAPTKPNAPANNIRKAPSLYDRTLLKPYLLKDKAPDTFQVKFVTENRNHATSEFTVTVTRAWAPLGADRFYNLVKHHYYDGARVFRVVPEFVAQFGLSAYPEVTAAWSKAPINDDPVTQKNKRGYLTFAKTALPNSRTTQIFINLRDNSRDNPRLAQSLDAMGFAPFGKVDGDGMNIVDMFYDQYSGAGDDQEAITKGGEKYIATKWPKLDIIKSATLIDGAASSAPAPKAATKPASAPPQQ